MTTSPTALPSTCSKGGPTGRLGTKALLVLLLGILSVATLPAATEDATIRLDGFDDYVREAVEAWQAPGLAVAVVHDGEIVFERGYGVRRLGSPGEVDEHTLFSIGSTTKAMTSALVAMLVDEGRIEWDDRVIEHLPWFRVADPWLTNELRVRDLLTHNGGLPNTDFLWYEQELSAREVVERMRYVEPRSSLRSDFVYQNVMYATAGQLIEEVSGRAWSELVEERIFEPLGMTRSVALLADTAKRDNVASPHDVVDGELVPIENASVDSVAAAGSVWSSVHEMAQWSAMLLRGGVSADGERLLSEESIAAMFRPWTMVEADDFYPTARLTEPHWTTYGLAWFQADYEGRRVDFHTGSIDGLVAIHGLIRDEDLGIVVLANRDHVELRHALMYRVFDLFDDQPPRDWSAELATLYDELAEQSAASRGSFETSRVDGTTPSRKLAEFAGTYADPLFGQVEVSLDDDALVLSYGRRRATLEHWHYDTFVAPWEARWRGRGVVTFEAGAAGRVDGLDMMGMTFERAPETASGN